MKGKDSTLKRLPAAMNFIFMVGFSKKPLNLSIPFYQEKKRPLHRSVIH